MGEGEIELNFYLYPKQRVFLTAVEDEILYCGSAGSGKSHALIAKLYRRASLPEAREGIARKTNADFAKSFLKTWERLIPSSLYSLNKKEQVITLNGGGQIYWFGVEDEARLGSMEMTGCGVEEASELTEEEWTRLSSLCRLAHPLGNQMYGVCNPKTKHHWMVNYFGVNEGTAAGRLYIHTVASDINAPDKYIAKQMRWQGVQRQRLFEGLWASEEGLVFSNFADCNVVEKEGYRRAVVAVDDGYPSPFVALRLQQDSGGRIHVASEFYQRGVYREEDKARYIVEKMKDDCEVIVVDSAASDLIRSLWDRGLPAVKSRKGSGSIAEGINRIRNLLATGEDNKPRLTISPSCKNLIREFRTHAYKGDSGEYENDNNHALDSLRYGIEYLQRGFVSEETKEGDEADKPNDNDSMNETVDLEDFQWTRL